MFTRQAQTLFCARPDYIQIDFRKSNTHNIFVNQIWTLWGGGLKSDSNMISTDASQSGCSDYTDQISVRHFSCFLLIDADVSHRLSNVPGNSETDRPPIVIKGFNHYVPQPVTAVQMASYLTHTKARCDRGTENKHVHQLGWMTRQKYHVRIFSWQNHDLDFITSLWFFMLVQNILQVTINSRPQFCLQTWWSACVWFLVPQNDFVLISVNSKYVF